MNKTTLKRLGLLAGHLPEMFNSSLYKMSIMGEDVLMVGINEIDGKKVESQKKYIMDNTLIRTVNHKLRIKRAFIKYGKKGVIDYCKKFVKKEKQDSLVEAVNMIL